MARRTPSIIVWVAVASCKPAEPASVTSTPAAPAAPTVATGVREAPPGRSLVGKLTLFRSGEPLAHAEVTLCTRANEYRCTDTTFEAHTTTDARGRYRFDGVPDGELELFVPLPDIDDCVSPFTDMFIPAIEVPDAEVCVMFELPPPP
jgi:hypothetical protein